MQYDIAVIGNDEAAVEMMCLAAESGRRTAAVLPDSNHSAWLVALALRRLISDLLVDQSISRRQLLARTGSPRLLRQLVAGAIVRIRSQNWDQKAHIKISFLCNKWSKTCQKYFKNDTQVI